MRGENVPAERGDASKLPGADELLKLKKCGSAITLMPLGWRASESPAEVELGGQVATCVLQKEQIPPRLAQQPQEEHFTFSCGAIGDSSLKTCVLGGFMPHLMPESVRDIDSEAADALGGKRSAGVLQK